MRPRWMPDWKKQWLGQVGLGQHACMCVIDGSILFFFRLSLYFGVSSGFAQVGDRKRILTDQLLGDGSIYRMGDPQSQLLGRGS